LPCSTQFEGGLVETMKKIAVLMPDESRLQEVQRLLAEYQSDIVFAVASILDGAQIVKELKKQGVEAVIARGESAANIKKENPDVVVVDVSITGFDLVRAVESARTFGDNIAVVWFPSMLKQIECLETALGVHIKRYNLTSRHKEHVNEMIDQALQEGADVIMGGYITTTAARERNLPCISIQTGNEGYLEAFLNARSLLVSLGEEKRKAGMILAVLNHAYEGILSVDAEGRITAVNPVAQRILRLNRTVGEPVQAVWPELDLASTLKHGKQELDRIYIVNGVQVLCNKAPIMDEKRQIGAVATFQDITKIQMAEARIRKEMYSRGHVAGFRFKDIYGTSKSVQAAVEMAKSFSVTEANILIVGETGSGKEVFAQSIHNHSKRARGPFVAVNCASIPPQLLESELFGYVGGAFTGASKEGKPGLFEVAHTGTIFLDEVAELDFVNQGRLLRVLQEKAVVRLGSDKVLPVDVRIVAATNKVLPDMVARNAFREDLFYRLNVLLLRVPPLRERRKDIGIYARQFLRELAQGRELALSRGALAVLEEYHWGGNIRELRNVFERICALAKRDTIGASFVKRILCLEQPLHGSTVAGAEATDVAEALSRCGGRIGDAAKELGVSRSTLWRKMNRWGIER
jgi:transcriptional regulator with PAS, ATPase and Fis domain